jgi:hypothetical protein
VDINGQTDFAVKAEPEDFKNSPFLAEELSRSGEHVIYLDQNTNRVMELFYLDGARG